MMAKDRYAGLGFEEVVQKYAKSVLTACLVRLNHQADAEDCFQNTFFKLYHHSPDFADENHLKAWLLRVAINECKKCLRDRNRRVPLSEIKGEALLFRRPTRYHMGADAGGAEIPRGAVPVLL